MRHFVYLQFGLSVLLTLVAAKMFANSIGKAQIEIRLPGHPRRTRDHHLARRNGA